MHMQKNTNEQAWLWKFMVKVALIALGCTLIYTIIRGLLPETMFQRLSLKTTAVLIVLLSLGSVSIYQRVVHRVHVKPRSSPLEVSRMIVEVGGLVKRQKSTDSSDHKTRVETWLKENVKSSQLPSLIEKGEYQFTHPNGDFYDLLIDFIELKDASDKTLEKILVSKGNKKQIEFLQKLAHCKLEWRCDHINT